MDTIFEIGGQDSKFISIENGVVVDFAMNEACAAGTGSFLEEQAEKLGISIKGEFAQLALAAPAPTRLGERCTVFMERDVTGWLHKGETVPNLVAGLAYSIALNYLNRVVRGRKIGNVIYFQGGTAYNDAVTAAFASLLGKKITVPPYNGVMGAIGMALIARQWHQATGARHAASAATTCDKLQLATRDFVCKACSNLCDMKEFAIEGQKSYWGDKCSDKFRKPSATGRKPVIDDLFAYRERLLEDAARTPPTGAASAVGLPRAMSMFDRYPFWQRYFAELGIETRALAGHRPAHFRRGHRDGGGAALLSRCRWPTATCRRWSKRAWTTSWSPTSPTPRPTTAILRRRTTAPGARRCRGCCASAPGAGAAPAPVPDSHAALPAGPGAGEEGAGRNHAPAGRHAPRQRPRRGRRLRRAARIPGRSCWKPAAARSAVLEQTGEPGLVLAGRGYNIYDRGVNCDIPRKLRHRYGANVIPLDFLVTGRESIGRPARQHVLGLGPQDPGSRAHGRAARPICTWSISPISSAGPIPTSSTSPARPPARRCWCCSSTATATTPAT